MQKQQLSKNELKAQAQAKLAALGFKKDRQLGMSILNLEENETVLVKVTSDVEVFTTKAGKEYERVIVDNLETGETDQTLWLSGQLRHTLRSQADGFIGGSFAITHLGQSEVEIDGETRNVNNYDVMAISQ
jgi:hypothetical protein